MDDSLKQVIGKQLSVLSELERKVMTLRFGLDGNPELSLAETAKAMKKTKERIRQIVSRATERLQEAEMGPHHFLYAKAGIKYPGHHSLLNQAKKLLGSASSETNSKSRSMAMIKAMLLMIDFLES